jgi:type I restriction enzyme M protein
LKDGGVTFHEYLVEISNLLFLRLSAAASTDDRLGSAWGTLTCTVREALSQYRQILVDLGEEHGPAGLIYQEASTGIRNEQTFQALLSAIRELDLSGLDLGSFGDIYEALLQRAATEKRSGTGQYFTPRPLIESMVRLIKPLPSDTVYDPAAGTGGFLVAAADYVNAAPMKHGGRHVRFIGTEHVHDTYRLGLMNLAFHGFGAAELANYRFGDSLAPGGSLLGEATVVLTNPPFGTKAGQGVPGRTDLPFPTSNKQLAFLQLIEMSLKIGGRAAIVAPDNVLFDNGVALSVRRRLFEENDCHTILHLPVGLFYAKNVLTSVLFLTKGAPARDHVWVYDLRTRSPKLTRDRPLAAATFGDFEKAYGADPYASPGVVKRRQSKRFRKVLTSTVIAGGLVVPGGSPPSEGSGTTDTVEARIDRALELLTEAGAALREARSVLQDPTV